MPADAEDPVGAEPGSAPGPGAAERPLRADAARNKAAIIEAAREVFAEHGVDAPLEEIAQRAGVGIATLYRRFPARKQLVAAALAEKVAQYAQIAADAVADPDPWAGFTWYVQRICELQAADRGLSDLLSMVLAADERIEALRAVANAHVGELIARAKAAGDLRADFTVEDLLLLLIASAAVGQVTDADAPGAWRRFVALALDAFRCQDSPGLPPAPSGAQMTQAMRRLAAEHGCGAHPHPAP